jgi:hypothetical protein
MTDLRTEGLERGAFTGRRARGLRRDLPHRPASTLHVRFRKGRAP